MAVTIAITYLQLSYNAAYADEPSDENNAQAVSELPDKTPLPIAIEADSAEQNDKLGITTYRGNVAITQGNLLIKADQVQIISKTEEKSRRLHKIVATGEPAFFLHSAASTEDQLVAEAYKINYFPVVGIIKLQEKASLVQQGSSVRGDHIEYYIADRRVKAQTDPSNKNTRVRTIITPDKESPFNTTETNR